jgi:hypothetical protein
VRESVHISAVVINGNELRGRDRIVVLVDLIGRDEVGICRSAAVIGPGDLIVCGKNRENSADEHH